MEIIKSISPFLPSAFAALVGAIAGAFAAFYLGRCQQRKDKKEKNQAALLRAYIALSLQSNHIEKVQNYFLEGVKKDPERHRKIGILYYDFEQVPRVDFDAISFVALSSSPKLIQKMYVAEGNYNAFVIGLKKLNLLKEKHSDQISQSNNDEGSQRSPLKYLIIKHYTDKLYDSVDRALPRIKSVMNEVEKFAKNKFKNMKCLKWDEFRFNDEKT